jgi:hypothetical protein
VGWAIALVFFASIAALVAVPVMTTSGSDASRASAVLDIVLGLVAGFFAWRTRRGSRSDAPTAAPQWMDWLDGGSCLAAFGLGLFIPPCVIALAAGNELARADLSAGQSALAVVPFTVIGSLGVLVPILVTVVRPAQSDAVIGSWRRWLELNWRAVVCWLLAAAAVFLVVKGLVELYH